MIELGKKSSVILASATLLLLWSSSKKSSPPKPWDELPKFEVKLVESKRNLSAVKEQAIFFETAEEIRVPITVTPTGLFLQMLGAIHEVRTQ